MTDRDDRQLVLLTGAAGHIGRAFRQYAGSRYRFRLADLASSALEAVAQRGDEVAPFDVADLEACRAACAGVTTVVHLAADPSPEADFYGSLLRSNIQGTYNIFRAAADAGCRRVVFASSVQTVAAYPSDVQARIDMPARPANPYGASKVFGEALASCFSETEGLSTIAVRIGAFWLDLASLRDASLLDLSAYVSPRDLGQLLVRCIEQPGIRFAVVPGISNNRFKRIDISPARELLGYAPEDDAFALAEALGETPGGRS